MKKRICTWLGAIPVLLLAPYLLIILFNGTYTALAARQPDIEACLPVIVSGQISAESRPETIKAQAVIARTNLYRRLKDRETIFEILGELRETEKNTGKLFLTSGAVFEKAVTETEGQVLEYKGELKLVPYHEISAGATRDGAAAFHNESYSYLKSVESSADKGSPDYLSSTYIAAQQMPRQLVIKERDEGGYVTSLETDGNYLEGEAFRQGMGLSSADFTVQKIGGQIRFLCRGKGHGLGFSQYGGNALAKSGSTCGEILESYFPEMELSDIHSIFAEK